MSIQPTFSGEVQFRRYSDTSTQGVQIVLALHDREALEPFIHKAGRRFACVLVEIGDDEQPVQEPERAKVGPLCREAVGYCEMPEFRLWINKTDGSYIADAAEAKQWILELCGVTTRKYLDSDLAAARVFKEAVRIPFMRYMKERKA